MHTPRKDRPIVWQQRVIDEARAQGLSALDVAKAAIDASFDRRNIANTIKLNAERAIKAGPGSRACAKYEFYAARCPSSIDAALTQLDRIGARHEFDQRTLKELRLILRWMRRQQIAVFADLVSQMAEAA